MVQEEACDRCGEALDGAYCQILTEDLVPKETVCLKCDWTDKVSRWRETNVLHQRLIAEAIIYQMSELREMPCSPTEPLTKADMIKLAEEYEKIRKAVKAFERTVWFSGGVQDYIQQARLKGHSSCLDDLTARMYALAGRVMITLEDKDGASVTVLTAENESASVMGLQSIYATAQQACELLSKASELAQQGRLEFQPDSEVGII